MNKDKPETTEYKGVKIMLEQVGHGWIYRLPSGARGVGLSSKDLALAWARRSVDQEQEPQP